MRLLFLSSEDYLPHKVGGAEWSTHYLVLELLRREVEVQVLCRLGRGWAHRFSRWLRPNLTRCDSSLGYPVWRAVDPQRQVTRLLGLARPDAVIAIAGFAQPLLKATMHPRRLLFLRDVRLPEQFQSGVKYLANSHFVAGHYSQRFACPIPVSYPLVPPLAYAGQHRGKQVLFVNPHPQKGLELVLQLAELCPELTFHFVESWPVHPLVRARLWWRTRSLPNVKLSRPSLDMRVVYAQTRVLLVPSQVPEAWGRVVSEAQHSLIPCLASAIGGLPESVGKAGVLLDPKAPPTRWAAELRRFFDDEDHYSHLSEQARLRALDPNFQPDRIVDEFLAVLQA